MGSTGGRQGGNRSDITRWERKGLGSVGEGCWRLPVGTLLWGDSAPRQGRMPCILSGGKQGQAARLGSCLPDPSPPRGTQSQCSRPDSSLGQNPQSSDAEPGVEDGQDLTPSPGSL